MTTTPPAEQQAQPGAVYAELPDLDSDDEPIWQAVHEWKTAARGADANEKANAVDSAIIDQLRDFADRTHRARLQCKSVQARLAALWGYVRADAAPKAAQPATGDSFYEAVNEMDGLYQAAPKAAQGAPIGWAADRVRIEKTEKNGWGSYLDITDADENHVGTIILCRGIDTENNARALAQNWMREFVPEPKNAAAPQQEAQEPTAFIHWPVNGPPRLIWYSQKALNEAILKTYEDGYTPDVKLYAAPQQEAQGATEIPDAVERMAADRYKVVPSHGSMFHRWAVVAGTGTQQLYLGREVECQNMARKFAGAFLDGAFAAMQHTAPQLAPAQVSERELRERCKVLWLVEPEDCTVLEAYDRGWADRAALAAKGDKNA